MRNTDIRAALLKIRTDKAIGIAKLGSDFSLLATQYGAPTEVIDAREFGLSGACKIWNYDELQVWSNAMGMIDRVFFTTTSPFAKRNETACGHELESLRKCFESCDIGTFRSVFAAESESVISRGDVAEFYAISGGTEVFAIFITREAAGIQYLSSLRINDVPPD